MESWLGTKNPDALSQDMTLPIPHGLYEEIYTRDVYGKNHTLKAGEWVIDAGAHIGIFSEKALRAGCKVIAFEPEPRNFDNLCKRIGNNEDALLFRLALWSHPRIVDFHVRRDHDGGHSSKWSTDQSFETAVWATCIDAMQLALKLPRIAFLKIDTEGSELEVLIGAKELLLRDRPDIAIEMHRPYDYRSYHQPIKDLLTSLNYSLSPSEMPPDSGWMAYASPL